MGQPLSSHVHRTVAILISKIKQENNKQKKKKPTDQGGCVGCDMAVVMVAM